MLQVVLCRWIIVIAVVLYYFKGATALFPGFLGYRIWCTSFSLNNISYKAVYFLWNKNFSMRYSCSLLLVFSKLIWGLTYLAMFIHRLIVRCLNKRAQSLCRSYAWKFLLITVGGICEGGWVVNKLAIDWFLRVDRVVFPTDTTGCYNFSSR